MVVTLVSMVVLLLCSSTSVIAANEQKTTSTDPSVTVDMIGTKEISNGKPGLIEPNLTVYGTCGTASLNWMSSYQGFSWEADPKLIGFEFVGNIHVEYVYLGTGYDIPISGIGVGSVSDVTEYVDIKSGIEATLTGVSTDMLGNTCRIVDGCKISVYP